MMLRGMMWANKSPTISSTNHRKSQNIIGSYNSLKDPHLKTHFRKPQIRRHLLKANIIDKDNKIVEEISTTKHQQNLQRKQKRELYQMLNEMLTRNDGQQIKKPITPEKEIDRFDSLVDSKKFINYAQIMLNNNNSKFKNHNQIQQNDNNKQRTLLVQKLDKMIKVIQEHNELGSKTGNRNLRSFKSQYDLSMDSSENTSESFKSCLSTPLLNTSNHNLKFFTRPKSSYGRLRYKRNFNENNSFPKSSGAMKKCMSMADVQTKLNNTSNNNNDDNDDDYDDSDIKSLEGESFDDSGSSDQEGNHKSSMFLFENSKNIMLNSLFGYSKKYYAYDKRFVKLPPSRQKIKMTLRYDGLSEATNLGGKRNIKVYQQITVGGNSILIYDGFVKPRETFTFDIRPHINNSFSINILVNGIRDLRLNTCCEKKHRPGTKLSHFTIIDVVGGRSCFSCQMQKDDILLFNDNEIVTNNKDIDGESSKKNGIINYHEDDINPNSNKTGQTSSKSFDESDSRAMSLNQNRKNHSYNNKKKAIQEKKLQYDDSLELPSSLPKPKRSTINFFVEETIGNSSFFDDKKIENKNSRLQHLKNSDVSCHQKGIFAKNMTITGDGQNILLEGLKDDQYPSFDEETMPQVTAAVSSDSSE